MHCRGYTIKESILYIGRIKCQYAGLCESCVVRVSLGHERAKEGEVKVPVRGN